jgi:translocator protein
MKFIISLLIPLAVGFVSGLFTRNSVDTWFTTINKPWFNPPSWVFGPVWTLLYLLMGVAMWLVWKHKGDETQKKRALYLYAVQLVFNFFWSIIFFHFHEPGWAFAEIMALWVLILLTIFAFAKVNKTAAWLLVPYISWVSFAAILNYTIWRMNP